MISQLILHKIYFLVSLLAPPPFVSQKISQIILCKLWINYFITSKKFFPKITSKAKFNFHNFVMSTKKFHEKNTSPPKKLRIFRPINETINIWKLQGQNVPLRKLFFFLQNLEQKIFFEIFIWIKIFFSKF